MPASDAQHQMLRALLDARNWLDLADLATELGEQYPDDADVCAYAAHALRQQGQLEAGYAWAMRGLAADPGNLFALNRASLLANLNHDYQTAWTSAAVAVALPEPTTDEDRLRLAVTIVNGIHAAARTNRIAEAIAMFGAAIDKLDHKELHFNTAAMYALAGARDRALDFTRRALATGKPKLAFVDRDFDRIRADPAFQQLLARDWIAEHAALGRALRRLQPIRANPYAYDDYEYREGFVPDDDTDGDRSILEPEDFIDRDELHVAPFQPVDRAVSPELEAAIVREPDDVAGYQIYADWFLEREDPRGQLILASLACESAPTESDRMLAYARWGALVQANARRWMGPLVDLLRGRSRVRWHRGFIRELVFDVGTHRRPGDTAEDLLATILDLPALRLVYAIDVRDIYAEGNLIDYTGVIGVLAARAPCLALVKRISIGPTGPWTAGASIDFTPITTAFERLEALVLTGGVAGTDTLSRHTQTMQHLALRSPELTGRALEAITAETWPQLEELELWFGRHATLRHELLAPILGGITAPKLRRLRLRDTRFGDALVRSLLASALLPQLTVLDLAANHITDDGGELLRQNSARLRHLNTLVLDRNELTGPLAAALQRVLPNVSGEAQPDEPDLDPDA